MICPNCRSSNVIEGLFQGYGGVTFVEKGTENKLFPKAYKVEAKACKDCGAIYDLRIASLGKNKVGE